MPKAAIMPHAIDDVTMDDADEESAAARYMDENGGVEAAASAFLHREIDQRDKAADAIDYEDISDLDDLPDEEEAAHQLEDDNTTSFLGDAENGVAHTNGHDESKEPSSDDMFGYEGLTISSVSTPPLPYRRANPWNMCRRSHSVGLAGWPCPANLVWLFPT